MEGYSQFFSEQCLLGAIAMNGDVINEIIDIIPSSEYFELDQDKIIYDIMLSVHSHGIPLDTAILLAKLPEEQPELRSYISALCSRTPDYSHAKQYAEDVKYRYMKRQFNLYTTNAIFDSRRKDISEVIQENIKKGLEILKMDEKLHCKSISEVMNEFCEEYGILSKKKPEEPELIKTYYSDLDAIINGFRRSNLVMIAGRPGMGKTSFILNLIKNISVNKNQYKILLFSIEMTIEEIALKLVSMISGVPTRTIKKIEYDNLQEDKIASATLKIKNYNIEIIDDAGLNITQIYEICMRSKPDLIMIDHLQIIKSSEKSFSRAIELYAITGQLKRIAKDTNSVLICLSQLSRATEAREGHRPQLSDLRDSGSIEQDSDIVMFLYNAVYYAEIKPDISECEIIVAKNRHGQTGTTKLKWDPRIGLFY